MSIARALVMALAVCAGALLPGCQGSGRGQAQAAGETAPARALPSYSEIARRYNERTDRLGRVWARAVVSLRFTDEKGKRRREQGEGHFQLVQPSRLAISIGKVGETFVWIGCDEERYWIIDAKESDRAFVGRHELASSDKIEALGLPAAPRSLIRLTGATPLPPAGPGLTYGWGPGGVILVEHAEGPAIWRYTIDADTMRPSRIEALRSSDRVIEASATLEDYAQVRLAGVGGFFPLMASRITAQQAHDDSEIRISLSGMNDGNETRLAPRIFDFEYLLTALGVRETVNLDEPAAAR